MRYGPRDGRTKERTYGARSVTAHGDVCTRVHPTEDFSIQVGEYGDCQILLNKAVSQIRSRL